MPLPDLIEIVPLKMPVKADIVVPGSKSITNRALILAALANGITELRGALWSEDTIVMVECLKKIGFEITVKDDPAEKCNRLIRIHGKGGIVPPGGTLEKPLDLFVGNAGTVARFLAALLALGSGVYRLYGVQRMHQRPQSGLFSALRQMGYRIESQNDKLPALIHGGGPRKAKCNVSISESSQFASALLMCARAGGWQVEISGYNPEEAPYVKMTEEMIKVFPSGGGVFEIEADASSASYFIASGVLIGEREKELSVKVKNFPQSGWQIDQKFEPIYRNFSQQMIGGGEVTEEEMLEKFGEKWQQKILLEKPLIYSRKTDLGDSIMTLITISPLSTRPVFFTDLERLRVQECERVLALKTELSKCGAVVVEEGETLKVYPSKLRGAEIETYNDHRIAMCFSVLGLKIGGIKIKNPECVKKTFPSFYQKMALPPPDGLGATIIDCATGEKLSPDELYIDW